MKASHDTGVRVFRQILFLPLTLSLGAGDCETSLRTAIDEIATELGSDKSEWEEIEDHLEHLGSAKDPYAYGEFVYFHPYIQQFLFDRPEAGKDENRALRLFRRKERGALDVKFACGGQLVAIVLPVARLHLYLFDLGVAILVVELASPDFPRVNVGSASEGPFTLAHLLALQNAVRRLYPPYFAFSDGTLSTPQYPVSLRWSWAMDERPRWANDWIDHVADHRVDPIDSAWARVLPGALHLEKDAGDRSRRWRQIVDERMPSMVFVAVENPKDISSGDHVRLCFMDDPEPSDTFPYSETFLQNFERENCFDIFWHYGTRYMFSGYSMVALGAGNPGNPKDFFCHTIVQHFRRHYFQMGLLIQFQYATLLAFSHRVSEATARKSARGAADDKAFRAEMLQIEDDFLTFEQRYWFTQISNQMQPREMYDLWLDRTGVRKIYEETRAQVRAANEFLDARAQQRQADAAERLSIVATWGVVLGLALAFLGMNVLASQDFLEAFGVPRGGAPAQHFGFNAGHARLLAAHLAVFAGALAAAMAAGRWLLRRYMSASDPASEAAQKLQFDLAAGARIGGVIVVAIIWLAALAPR